MTNRRGNSGPRNNGPNHPETSIPNSVARRRATVMGSTFSSSRRGTRNNPSGGAAPGGEQSANSGGVSDVYGTRYSHRSLNLPHRVRAGAGSRLPRAVRRHTTTSTPTISDSPTVREPSDQTPGPRRSARISSRMSEMETPTVVPFPQEELRTSTRTPPTRPISSAASSRESLPVDDGWQWREFANSPHVDTRSDPLPPIHTPSLFTPTPITPVPPVSTTPVPTTPVPTTPVPTTPVLPYPSSNPPPAASVSAHPRPHSQHSNDNTDTDIQSVEIVRVVPHRLIEIPSDEPFEPRPPPRQRPTSGRSSQNSGILRRARRLLRDSSSSSQSTHHTEPEPPSSNFRASVSGELPSSSTQSISAPDMEFAGSSGMSDDILRGRLFEHAENEALNNMILSNSVTANERSQRLRLLRLSRRQDSDVTPRERLISGLLRRRETQGK